MSSKVSVIGLGYVGLPLAVAFSSIYKVTGYDVNKHRINDLKKNIDRTKEISRSELKEATLCYTSDPRELKNTDIFIITVPTPVYQNHNPDLRLLKKACKEVSKYIQKGNIVVFESTVFPGCTDEICIPILEKNSGKKINRDFYVGYSPERINPGDKEHGFTSINKVVSGSNNETAKKLAKIYGSIINAEIFIATSIKVAEAAKIIENTQRDINIALMNEFSSILRKMGVRTKDVLDAANTKWNFLDFKPGLVGGHCIGVDPYYLAYKSKDLGITPKVILAGREINNAVPNRIVKSTCNSLSVKKPKVLILGITFKPNCPDLRNSKAIDVIGEFNKKNITPHIFDPYFLEDPHMKHSYIFHNKLSNLSNFDACLLLVPHKKLLKDGPRKIKKILKKKGYFFDMNSSFPSNYSDGSL